MFILGLQGSPRKKGNTSTLLASFMAEAERLGACTHTIEAAQKKIRPCIGCGHCEKYGFCVIKDEMADVYGLLRRADLIVMAAPIFFYNVPAQLKALIDRSQTLWSRRYVHKINDPGQKWRTGIFLAVGATKGKNLFEGVTLTAKYFYDAVGARFDGSLTFRQIEEAGAIAQHPTALEDAKEKASLLAKPFLARKKILFFSRENSCRSQMASAFAQHLAGDKIEVESTGSSPAEEVNEVMVQAMHEKGIDMAFRKPKSTADVVSSMTPDLIVSMGCEKECPLFPDAPYEDWALPDPADKPIGSMREIRDTIEERVKSFIAGV